YIQTPAADTYSTTVSADVDGNVYNYDQLIVYSKSHPVIDIKSKCPNSKPSRIYLKADTLSSNHGKFETKVENVRDISIDANGEANIQKDNVAFKLFLNSDKLGVKNYKIDITSKDADNGKRLEFHATNDGKNMLSGSTSFISKHEGPKTIIEGSGSVKVKNEQKSANFKYISTQLTDGNEQGIEEFVNLAIGGSSYVAERRITNLEYKTSYAYCEEKKQCASAELQSKINVPKPGSTDPLQHLLNVVFDLRKLGVAPEFGLQIINEVSEKRLPQYSLDLHINKDDKKYSLHAYSHPEYGKFPAGITVTLPQRVLALESLVTYPTNKALPFPIKGEVALHLDKNKPQTKTAARFMVDFADNKQQRNAVAEIGFSHPKLGREALLKFRGNLAQTNENTFKVEYFAVASHPTLGKDREAKLFLEVNPVHIKLLIENPFLKVIDLEGSVVVKDNLQQGDLKFALLESKPVTVHTIVKDFTYYEFTVDEHDHKLSVIGHLQPEQRVDISADIFVKNEKKNIAFGALYLKDNLVKSDYGLSKDNLKYFTTALQSELSSLKQHVEQLGEKASQDVKSTLKQVEPKFKELQKAYVEEIEKVYKELANDKVLKEISEGLYQIVTYFAKFIDSIMQVTKPVIDQIVNTVQETAKKGLELFEKQVEPQLKQLYANIAAVLQEYFEGLLDIVAHFAALVQDFFDKHKPELQELTNTFAEIFKDLTRLLVAQLKEFRAKVGQIAPEIIQQIKELPIINLIKEKYQELAIPEQALGLLEEGHNTVRELLPTEETKKFADAFVNYVLKKLRQEKVDDSAELRRVYEKFTVALTSLVNHVRQQLGGVAGPAFLNINTLPLFSGPGQVSAPSFAGGVSFSLLNQFLKGDVPDPLSLLRAYRPRRLNPFDEIPAVLRAVVVNGQHIFTFDGRHLTFPGSCRYVLAHDFVDRNFTLALQLANGAPKSLILQDKSGTTLELKDNGQVAVNGASHGYPAIEKDVFAFRETGGRVGLGSRYGLMVFCRNKLEVSTHI
ncbi:apolipophorins-like, partial [Hyposmocoma kahamanoa]|uniref:apolipophorins-like n=1 Tax=Hyposmocoma kahamanoa TaxID=1477025 RepID=UPI000E6D9A62